MHTIQLGMVVLDVHDLARSLAFYRRLGLDIPDPAPDRPVTVHRMPSGVSLVLAEGFAASVDPGWVRPASYQQMLEFMVGDAAAVDAMWTALTSAGHHGRLSPATRAGIRTAMVDDPDGNVVLLSDDPAANPSQA